ncbi:LysE/ArgO family amino acid transporter [Heyndrickxia oleronia]|jgi:L-lysine exporter family protein LysE/ArgO|uniref:Lysine transporter LysE n=1 Tax=Heyndrickxia oleronia TaxID=38875 RepID=A0A8E2I968_9BACI|nr:LysE/ArgO family amino acid transporter [Heyndrickxia oleronia]NYV64077.1 amino acid transporter [Bacillus sp. Gen3]OJH16123.1 lysine transporter LysE [Bacillus obstructivus]MBU5214863.1 LysE/ArgO family amino acid transporter [Heyndrickxia oleronia]MEC1375542.1 LysE/ArgO family amino acid transporter [Heyndrickxia oleronia]OOP68313.1 lysine transporter LysE [Heyndrickxia oleronia]
MIEPFIHGFILSLGLILPLGVQNVFIFNQGAMQPRYMNVLPVVITASLCDTLLILVSVLGVSLLILGSFWFKVILIGGGVIFLVYMGWTTWNSKPNNQRNADVNKFSLKKQLLFAASVSLLNPHAIMDTVGVIGTSSIKYHGVEKVIFAFTCIMVSWLWFIGLSLIGRVIGKIDKSGTFLLVLNKISAIIMWAAAVYLVFSLFNL